jgi:uncharacterized membrane-anchored protein
MSSAAPAPSGSASVEAPVMPWQAGPRTLDLGHSLDLALPEHYAFLGMPHAGELMKKIGNFHNENLVGVVVPDDDAEWFVSIRYDEVGYVKDDEKIDSNELLQAIKEGTEEANKERVAAGFKALNIEGWSQEPAYDRGKHHLVWGITAASQDGKSINYNTRVLGRRGYVSINLVTAPETAAEYRPHATALLAATTFRPGARYEDFDSKLDKVAEYGLTGLILGGAGLGAAKLVKLGFFAKFWNVILAGLIAMKKGVIFVVAGIAALLKKIFGRKNEA